MNRPRLAFVTSHWPLQRAPYEGIALYNTALALLPYADPEVFHLAARYPSQRWLQPRHHVYYPADPAYAPPGLKRHLLEFRTLPYVGRLFNGVGMLNALRPALRAFRPDLVLAYWLFPTGWAAVRVAAELGVPAVVVSMGSDLHNIPNAFARARTSATLRRAAAVVAVSRDLRCRAIALGAVPERAFAVSNGCDASIFHPQDRDAARTALALPSEIELVTQAGHLLLSKGIFDLWEAFERLAPQRPALTLAFVGEGPARAELEARAAASGLAARLLLPGARLPREVALWMNASDVVALASHGEGCPGVILEGLSCGRPIVATNVGGIPDLVTPDSGILAPARDPAAFAAALAAAMDREWDPARIAAAHARSWDAVARDLSAILTGVLARR